MKHSIIPASLVAAALLVALALVVPRQALAQNIAGEYQVEVRGTTHYLDREPVTRDVRGNTTLTVKQSGDRITISFGSFAGAMSRTTFEGRVGNDRFVAVWAHASGDGQLRMITGEVDGNRLRGRLVYPRATAEAGVPGWTEVEFTAVTHQGQSSQRQRATPSKNRSPGAFAVDVRASTDPEAPLAGHRVEFFANGVPNDRGATVARMELWINGNVQGSSAGNELEVTAGPFAAGRLDYQVVAISTDGTRSRPSTHSVNVAAAGNSRIAGRVTGSRGKIRDVQLVRLDGRTAAKTTLDSNGRYRFQGVPAGKYLIFVNDGDSEAYVTPTSNLRITVDRRSSYTRNFEVR